VLVGFSKRKAYLTKGKELLKLGKNSEARECFQKCIDISPEMALAFIKVIDMGVTDISTWASFHHYTRLKASLFEAFFLYFYIFGMCL